MSSNLDYAEAMGVLNRVTAERDRARDIAVALEQELAHVNELVDAAAIKLRLLSAVGAIDISNWNAVAALVAWSERERP